MPGSRLEGVIQSYPGEYVKETRIYRIYLENCRECASSTKGRINATKGMKKGANTDRGELKIGCYKLLAGIERLFCKRQNDNSRTYF